MSDAITPEKSGGTLAAGAQYVLDLYQSVSEQPGVQKFLNKVSLGLAVTSGAQTQSRYVFPDCTAEPLASNPICDTSLSRAERAAGLVQSMNITEKLGNIVRYVMDLQT